MPEVGVGRAGGERPGSRSRSARRIEPTPRSAGSKAIGFVHQHLDIWVGAQDRPDGLGNVGRRQHRQRDLVEERLERCGSSCGRPASHPPAVWPAHGAALMPAKPPPMTTTRLGAPSPCRRARHAIRVSHGGASSHRLIQLLMRLLFVSCSPNSETAKHQSLDVQYRYVPSF